MAGNALTKGEIRVLRTYAEQETHELAAAELGISTQTLKNHLGSIYKKLNVRKAHSAIYQLALNRGIQLLQDPDFTPETHTLGSQDAVLPPTLTIDGVDRHNGDDEAAN